MIPFKVQGPSIRILAIDVGAGTQDTLVYDSGKKEENCIKTVVPARTQVLARRVMGTDGDLLIDGGIMGGGPFSHALSSHIEKGHRVVMTRDSARSIRDDLDQVREMGVEVVDELEGPADITTGDVDYHAFRGFIEGVGEAMSFDAVGIAVQDHGNSPGVSDRVFRFETFRERIEGGAALSDFLFTEPPEYFTRMVSALSEVKQVHSGPAFVADTKIAAVAGALHGVSERPVMAVDIGNGHTLAALIGEGDRVLGLFEHHTGCLDPLTLASYLDRFSRGDLGNDEVLADEGHGCIVAQAVEPLRILVTGPNRMMLGGEVEYPAPFGDVMMTGPVGLVDMIRGRL